MLVSDMLQFVSFAFYPHEPLFIRATFLFMQNTNPMLTSCFVFCLRHPLIK
jgi:hypothetical protein